MQVLREGVDDRLLVPVHCLEQCRQLSLAEALGQGVAGFEPGALGGEDLVEAREVGVRGGGNGLCGGAHRRSFRVFRLLRIYK